MSRAKFWFEIVTMDGAKHYAQAAAKTASAAKAVIVHGIEKELGKVRSIRCIKSEHPAPRVQHGQTQQIGPMLIVPLKGNRSWHRNANGGR